MGFDFFKKKDGKGRSGKGDDSLFADSLEFDDIETSGEFLSGSEAPRASTPAPPPVNYAPPSRPVYQAPPPPPPPTAPAYPRAPAPMAYPPAGDPVDNDLTVVNRPPVIPRGMASPQAPVVPQAGYQSPVAPGAPVAPRAPVSPRAPVPPGPPAYQPPSAPRQPAGPPPGMQHPGMNPVNNPAMPPPMRPPSGLADDEVTQVLNKPVSSQAVVAWLVIADGTMRGEDFRLPGGTARLGQHPQCEIRITGDTFISTQHAEFRFQGGTYWVHDLGSTNGLFRNGSRITQAALEDGDQIKAGTTTLVFKSVKI